MNVEFKMSDGLIIRGTIEGDIQAKDLIIMLHSGGYTKDERGIREVREKDGAKQIIYYNPKGNYEYLSDLLSSQACVLRIDLRNHGVSGKNINKEAMIEEITKIDNSISLDGKNELCRCLLENDKRKMLKVIDSFKLMSSKKNELLKLVERPIILDSSFIRMKDDLKEIIGKIGFNYQNYHLVGTCMGALISALYAMENPNKIASLTFFSPLFTLDQAFLKLDSKDEFAKKKKEAMENHEQFRIGNQVEGEATYQEIKDLRPTFYDKLKKINIPIFAIQGQEDKLIKEKEQDKIFEEIKNYHYENDLADVYYATISPGVHSLYDVVMPTILEASEFIKSRLVSTRVK